MIVKSPYVDKEFNIPDEKLPDAPRFAMKCPFTGKRIVFEKQGEEYAVSAGEPVETAAEPAPKPAPEPEQPAKPQLDLPQVEPDIHPPGTKVAFLFLDGGWLSAATEFFEGAGYAVSTAEDELEAIAKLRLNNYDVVVCDCCGRTDRLRDEIASWNGGKRRGVNYILVGEEGRSNDPQAIFVHGANSYLAASDEGRAKDLLEGALTGYDLHYQLWETAKQNMQG